MADKTIESTPHVGREGIDLKAPPKKLVQDLGRYEYARIIGECTKAGLTDIGIDLTKKAIRKMPMSKSFRTLVNAPLELVEMAFEHTAEEAQGKEHTENMNLLIEATLTMYREQLKKPNQDQQMLGDQIHKLEWMLAKSTGDITKVKEYEKAWAPVVAFMNMYLDVVHSKVYSGVKHVVLEVLDKIPFACPESIMEVKRFTNLLALAKIYNKHPDVSGDEKLHVGLGSLKRAFEIQALRIRAFVMGPPATATASAAA